MIPIILPAGTVSRWQALNQIDESWSWEDFACDLLDDACTEPDPRIKDDIILLALVASERAKHADPALAYNLTPLQQEAA
jgi:hypothetical protein